MIYLLLSAFVLLFMIAPSTHAQLCLNNDFYENRTAAMKFGFLWDAIREADRESAPWFTPLEMQELFTEPQEPSVFHKSDFFPQGRKKFIHTVGAVAQCEFNFDNNHPYTGLFDSGSQYALCRAGSSTRPTNTTITPGFAFKLLRNRVPSANFFAMYQLDPQKTGGLNFFKNVLSNHLAARPDLPPSIQLLRRRFQSVSKWPGLVGLSDAARWDQRGREVANPKYPFALVFQPNPALTKKFDGWTRFDVENYFPSEFRGYEVLYQIYAVPDIAEPPRLIPIGNVRLRSKFYPSKFADQQLFFRHQLIEEDLVNFPQWTDVLTNTTRQTYEGADFYSPYLPRYNCRD